MKKILCALLGLILTLPGFAACPTGQIEQTYTSATGTVTQNGTPTPDNPIEPVFYQQGNMILRKVGDYADSYDATTGKITRRVGVKVLTGNEEWKLNTGSSNNLKYFLASNILSSAPMIGGDVSEAVFIYSSIVPFKSGIWYSQNKNNGVCVSQGVNALFSVVDNFSTVPLWKEYLQQQYAAGNPVTVWYPLATEATEDWNETTYCITPIKIATTAYNSVRFSPVVTELNDTIATIRSVVTNTINQTKAIADLQATKQTRPDETCPAGKKCLLVEDDAGQPHWYEIIESANRLPDGFTELAYLESTGTQYIDTGVTNNEVTKVDLNAKVSRSGTQWIFGVYSRSGGGIDIASTSADTKIIADIGGNNHRISSNVISTAAFYHMVLDITNREFYIDDTLIGSTTAGDEFLTNNAILFGTNYIENGTTGGAMKMKYAKIWKNGSLVRDYVPARRESDDVLGMYDTVNGQFYTNQGTGTFTAGPEIQ